MMRRIFYLTICAFILLCGKMSCVTFAVGEHSATVYENNLYLEDGSVNHLGHVLLKGTFYDALEYVNSSHMGGGVVLSENLKLSRGVVLQPVLGSPAYIQIEGDVELDLNGYFITQLAGGGMAENPVIIVPKGSTLTITDSSEGEKGVITGVQYGVGVWGGNFILNKGCIKTQSLTSINTDYYEQIVQITQRGTFTMNGGMILYSGNTVDSEVYNNDSCAIFGDETANVTVNDGMVGGEIQIKTGGNLKINGGKFGFDVANLVSDGYRVNTEDGIYTVKKHIPIVSAECDGKSAETSVKVEYDDTEEFVKKYIVSMVSDIGDIKNLKLEISDVIKSANSFSADKISAVELVTDFASVTIDGEDIRAVYDYGYGEKVYLIIEKKINLDDEIYEKLSGAKYGIYVNFVDENDNEIYERVKSDLKITHYATEESVMIYSFADSLLRPQTATVESDSILCEISNGETLIVSEGINLMITGRTLDLHGTISMIFYASLEGVNSSDVKMLFWEEEQSEYTEETADRIVSYSGKDSNGYRFKYENITAKDMNKKIYARLMVKDSTGKITYGKVPEGSYSVVNYAENMMENLRLKPLLVKMLNYGAAAQEYFESEELPANSILTDAQRVTDFTKIYRSQAATITEDTINGKCEPYIAGKTISLEGDISINYYVVSEENVDEVGVLFWTEDGYESAKSHIVGTQSYVAKTGTANGRYMVFSYDNIVSSQMFESVYARVYTRSGDIYKYGDIDKYSVRDYAVKQIEKNDNPGLVKLLRCLLLYGDEAEKYFRL